MGVLDPNVTQLKGSKGEEAFTVDASGTVAANSEDAVLDITQPCVIDHLTWGSESDWAAQIRIQPYINGTATSIGEIEKDGSVIHGFVPNQINEHGSSIWETLVYDETDDYYSLSFRRAWEFAEGVKITVRNTSGSPISNGVVVHGRKFLA